MTQANARVLVFRPRAIPESIRKKAARDAALSKNRAAARADAKAKRATSRKTAAANAAKYASEAAAAEQKLIADKRAAKAEGNFFVEADAKVAFVIRTRG